MLDCIATWGRLKYIAIHFCIADNSELGSVLQDCIAREGLQENCVAIQFIVLWLRQDSAVLQYSHCSNDTTWARGWGAGVGAGRAGARAGCRRARRALGARSCWASGRKLAAGASVQAGAR